MHCVNNNCPTGCGCNGNRAGCGCNNGNRAGCGCNETRNGNGNRAGCGCNNGTRAGCGCNGGCGCNCCRPWKTKGASFLAPESITVLTNQQVPLVAQLNFSDGDIFHEIDSPNVSLSEGIYEINYNFNAYAHCDTLLSFGLFFNGLIDVTTKVVENVQGKTWNAFSKTIFLSVFSPSQIALTNLSPIGIELGELNLTIKKISNVSVL